MDASELRRWCLQQAGAVEEFPFGPETSVFKVAGKIFSLSALGRVPLEVSVKCEPVLAVALRDSYPAIRPGYHLNKRHWNTIRLDGSLPDELVRDLIEDSYDLVVSALPKRVREQLGWRPLRTEPSQIENLGAYHYSRVNRRGGREAPSMVLARTDTKRLARRREARASSYPRPVVARRGGHPRPASLQSRLSASFTLSAASPTLSLTDPLAWSTLPSRSRSLSPVRSPAASLMRIAIAALVRVEPEYV